MVDNESFIDGEDVDVSSWYQFANHASPNVMMVMVMVMVMVVIILMLMLMLMLIMQTLNVMSRYMGNNGNRKYQHYPLQEPSKMR